MHDDFLRIDFEGDGGGGGGGRIWGIWVGVVGV